MGIVGAHVLLYTPEAEALRTLLRDALGWEHVDAGDGWLIFALPPAEVAAHPTDGEARHELYLMCDNLRATVEELEAKGVEVSRDFEEAGFGLMTSLRLPGGSELRLYEPRHERPPLHASFREGRT